MTEPHGPGDGAGNLLVNCADLKPGETLLIVAEDPALGWYDAEMVKAVIGKARDMGLAPDVLEVGKPGNDPEPRVAEAIAAHDCTIFFARLGDQDRFGEAVPGRRSVMCYVRDIGMLSGAFGRTTHQAFVELKEAVNAVLLGADRIEISCPLGTDYAGTASQTVRQQQTDVSIERFPLGVPLPMDGAEFSGRVALANYLTPTGSRVYEPAYLALESPIFGEVERGKIVGFSGETGDVDRVREHYKRISGEFGIDPDVVHSWHAGIHPGCAYTDSAADDPDRWSNTVFGNPRFVHFHTCGAYAPGEICWMVLDQTIAIDGVALWEKGRLRPEAFARTKICLENWPELNALFANPTDSTGLQR